MARISASSLLNYFCRLYLEKIGYPYPIQRNKHTSIVKSLMKTYEERVVRLFFKFHLESQDPFIVSTGHSLETLKCKIPNYLQRISQLKTKASTNDYERLFG